jgi:hypothetical protein
MDYHKIYEQLTAQRGRVLEMKETHHIKPKSIGGDDSTENLVELTPREHYIAHKLLVKITHGEDRKRMAFALWRMTNSGAVITARDYETARKVFVEYMSAFRTGKKFSKHSNEARKKASLRASGEKNNMFGKTHTEEARKKISENRSGKMVGEDNHFFGKTHTDDVKKQLSIQMTERMKGVPKKKHPCIHCGNMFAPNMLNRFHNDNCKMKPVT